MIANNGGWMAVGVRGVVSSPMGSSRAVARAAPRALLTLLTAALASLCCVRLTTRAEIRRTARADQHCARDFQACGAIPAPNDGSRRCCNADFFCFRRGPYFSQCRPRTDPAARHARNQVVKMLIVDVPHAEPAAWRLVLRTRIARRLRHDDPTLRVEAHRTLPVLYVTRKGGWSGKQAGRVARIIAQFRQVDQVTATVQGRFIDRRGKVVHLHSRVLVGGRVVGRLEGWW